MSLKEDQFRSELLHLGAPQWVFMLFKQLEKIMATQEEVKAALEELNAAIAAEHAEVMAELEKLNQEIADLEAAINSGTSPEDLQKLVDELKKSTAAVSGIITSSPTEPPPEGGRPDNTLPGNLPGSPPHIDADFPTTQPKPKK